MIHDFGEFLVVVLDISGKSAKRVGAPPDLNVAALREIFERHSIEIKSADQKLYWPEEPAIQQLGHLISETTRNQPRKKSKRAARPMTVRSLMLTVLFLGTFFGTCLRLRDYLENRVVLYEQQIADQQKLIANAVEAKQSAGENWPRIQPDHLRGIRHQDDLVKKTRIRLTLEFQAALYLALLAYLLTPMVIIFWLASPKQHDDPKKVRKPSH